MVCLFLASQPLAVDAASLTAGSWHSSYAYFEYHAGSYSGNLHHCRSTLTTLEQLAVCFVALASLPFPSPPSCTPFVLPLFFLFFQNPFPCWLPLAFQPLRKSHNIFIRID